MENKSNFSFSTTSETATETVILALDGVTASEAEINLNDGAIAGTAVASKTLALGTDKNVDVLAVADLKLGAGAGTSVTATAVELNTLDLSVAGSVVKTVTHTISTTPTGAEQDTGVDLPLKGLVLGVYVEVTTAEVTGATKTIDVGLLAAESGGSTNGFVDGVSVATLGTVSPDFVFIAGGTETYVSDTTYGTFLRTVFLAGTNTAGDVGTWNTKPHVLNGTAKSLVYQAGGVDFAEFRGKIHVLYVEFA